MLETQKYRILSTFILGALWLIIYISSSLEYTRIVGYCSAVLLSAVAILLLVRSLLMKNMLLFIFFAFIYLYTRPTLTFFFKGMFFSGFHLEYSYETVTQVNLIFMLFLLVINGLLKIPKHTEIKRLDFKKNNLVFWTLYLVSLIIVFVSKRTGSVYMGLSEQVEVSPLNEYVIILFLILYIYSNGKPFYFYLLSGLYILYAAFALLSGGRIEVVLLLLMLFAVRFQYTFSFKSIIILLVFGVWGMSVFGHIRSNPMILFSSNIKEILNPFKEQIYQDDCQRSNESDVYWASERILILINEGELTPADRVEAGIRYLLSPVLPNSASNPLSNLSSYKTNVLGTGGGGLAPIFMFAFWGLAGVVLLGVFIAFMLNALTQNISTIKYIYILLLIITVPRWFAYYPLHLIKFCIYGFLVYYIIGTVDYTIRTHLPITHED